MDHFHGNTIPSVFSPTDFDGIGPERHWQAANNPLHYCPVNGSLAGGN